VLTHQRAGEGVAAHAAHADGGKAHGRSWLVISRAF
jgi:hypothetical protein